MQPVVLLAVAAVWAAVIVPPLMRSRNENRPNSSVTDFRRQLSTLQRAVPTRTMVPMRSMARPLTQAPQGHRVHGAAGLHAVQREAHEAHGHAGHLRRSSHLEPRSARTHHTTHLHRVSQRELVRRRRANVLYVLALTTGISAFLAATTHASALVWLFGLSFVALCAYCYKLAQLRSLETTRQWGDGFYRAA